ncbi:MAG: hypothetical protein JWQ13_3417 [Ramlibacter sp.]|nr:hypothetical protein [Ramlibacter sp.]
MIYCARCDTIARKIHRPFLLRLVPFAHLYYCWPCHRRFVSFVSDDSAEYENWNRARSHIGGRMVGQQVAIAVQER